MLFSYRFYIYPEMDLTVGIVRAANKAEAESKIRTHYKGIDNGSFEIDSVDFKNDIIETYYGKSYY